MRPLGVGRSIYHRPTVPDVPPSVIGSPCLRLSAFDCPTPSWPRPDGAMERGDGDGVGGRTKDAGKGRERMRAFLHKRTEWKSARLVALRLRTWRATARRRRVSRGHRQRLASARPPTTPRPSCARCCWSCRTFRPHVPSASLGNYET